MTEREYNECVTSYADNVYRFIFKNLGHEEDTKDVIQSAYEKLWINRLNVEVTTARSYLFTIAYNQMIDHIRKNKRLTFPESIPGERMPSVSTSDTSRNRLLQEALGTLGETQRSLVMLKDYEGYSYQEIGAITGLNESQVKVYLHRARLQLRAYIVKPENVI